MSGGMDWTNERYVRLYVRDSTTWKRLGWDGQCVLMHLLRKVDRAGTLGLSGVEAWEAVMLQVGCDEAVARRGVDALLRTNTAVVQGDRLIFPTFIEAQECSKSDRQRQRESREKKARIGIAVTTGHDSSQPVTIGHSVLCSAVLSSPDGEGGRDTTQPALPQLTLVSPAEATAKPPVRPEKPAKRPSPASDAKTALKAATARLSASYGHEVPPTAGKPHWAAGAVKVTGLVSGGVELAEAAERVARAALERFKSGRSSSYGYALQDCVLGASQSPRRGPAPAAPASAFADAPSLEDQIAQMEAVYGRK